MKARFLVVLILVCMLTLILMGDIVAQGNASPTATRHPVDVVLVLDASESMAYDPPSGFAYTGDPSKGCSPIYVGTNNVSACVKACNDDPNHPCYPLQQVKDAAKSFVDQLRPGIDRIAIVSYARYSTSNYPLGADLNAAKAAIDGIRASDNGGMTCAYLFTDPWKCGSSNPGGALWRAAYELEGDPGKIRQDSLWVAVLLSSGGMNATDPMMSADPDSSDWGVCPAKIPGDPASKNDPPPCRDQQWSVHHPTPIPTTATPPPPPMPPGYWYDAEDYTYDKINFLGKPPTQQQYPDNVGAQIYAIALGQKAVCTTGQTYSPGPPVTCGNWNVYYEDLDSHLPNTGELFLRYAAAIGDDGDPSTDLCAGIASGVQCGNYFFVPSGAALQPIFLRIANFIFTPTLPIAAFDVAPQAGIAPVTIYFTNTSTGSVVDYLWDFGDAITSTLPSPTHTYTTPGVFTVTLRVDNPAAYDILTRTNYITVYTPVSADFVASPISGTRPLTVTFTNQSLGDFDHALWNFGDGITSTTFNPTHIYWVSSTYTVTLQVSGLGGTNSHTRDAYITVIEPRWKCYLPIILSKP